MSDHHDVVVERTRNRSSRAVLRDGRIVIRLAHRLTKEQEKEHIEWLLQRMKKVVERERKRITIDPFRQILKGEDSVLLSPCIGEPMLFVLQPSSRLTVRKSGNTIILGITKSLDGKKLHRHLWNVFCKVMQHDVENFVWDVNANTFRANLTKIKLKHMATQWGSCTKRSVIALNPSLLFVKREYLEYVVVHELAHTLHGNHGRRFWKAVSDYCVNFDSHRKNLNQYRISRI